MRIISRLMVLVLVSAPLALAAQERTRSGAVEDDEPFYARRFALLIGVNYSDSKNISILQNAEEDAASLKNMLEASYNFKCRLLTKEATKQSVLDALEEYSKQLTKDDCFLFYFAGHGVTKDKLPYLLPADIEKEDGTLDIDNKGLFAGQIIGKMQKTKAKHTLFVFDSCYSGESLKWFETMYPSSGRIETRSFAPRSVQILASSGSKEKALDGAQRNSRNSPFAVSFLDFLRSPAKTKKKHLTATELASFVEDEFKKRDINQHPQFAEAKLGEGMTGGDFHFIIGASWPEPRSTNFVFQTLPGPPGEWWFDEMPWLIPEVRLILDAPETRILPAGEAVFTADQETTPDPSDVKSRNQLKAVISRLSKREIAKPLPTILTELLQASADSEFTERRQVYDRVLAAITSRSLDDAPSLLHLRAVLLHALKRPEATDAYVKAVTSYGDEQPGLRLRCLADQARWYTLSSGLAQNSSVKHDHLKNAVDTFGKALAQAERLDETKISPLVKVELFCGMAQAHRSLARDEKRLGRLRLFQQAEDLFEKAVDLVDEKKLAQEHPVRGYIAERRAWTYMDQWKVAKAIASFAKAQSVWRKVEESPDKAVSYAAFLRRSHAQHGLAMTCRLSGQCALDRYEEIRDELQERIETLRAGSKEYAQLYVRLQNTTERWADCHLLNGRADMELAAKKYRDSVRQLKQLPEEDAALIAEQLTSKMVIAATLCRRRELVEEALRARTEYAPRESKKPEEDAKSDEQSRSIYLRLSDGFEKLNDPDIAVKQKGLTEIRTIVRASAGQNLIRDHQELLLLAAEVVASEQQRLDARLLDSLVSRSARRNASHYFRDKQDKSIWMQSQVVREDRNDDDFSALVNLVQQTKQPGKEFVSLKVDRPFAVFYFQGSKDVLLIFVRGSEDWAIRQFSFGALQLKNGLREDQKDEVNQFLSDAGLPKGAQVRWNDDEVVMVPKPYPFSMPVEPKFD